MMRILMTLVSSALLLGCVCFLSSAPVVAQRKTKPDAIAAEYKKTGGSKGDLGAPSGSAQSGPRGGRFRAYQNGAIYWSSTTGAHAVSGAAFEKYKAAGATTGALGYPVTDVFEMKTGGQEIVFQHGFVVLNKAGETEMTTTPWATFSEHGVTVARGVKAQKQTEHTAFLLPETGPAITFSCACKASRSLELGACKVTIRGGDTVSCTAGTCRSGCSITVVT